MRPAALSTLALPALAGLAASTVVLADLCLRGPMAWHYTQPEAIEGGVEALLLAAALALAAWRGGRAGLLAGLIVAGLYLRRHHVDLPVLAAWLAAEGWVAWGLRLQRGAAPARLLTAAVLGFALWLALNLVLHALWLARPPALLIALAGFTALGLALQRGLPLLAAARIAFTPLPPAERAAWSLLAAWLLVLMARSNQVIGFDTLWYPARGGLVLAPSGSFFEPLGLVSAVHYFPKLWELSILPWEGLGDLSFPAAQALIGLAGGLTILAHWMGQGGLRGTLRPIALLALATLPALAASALQLKTDLPAWFFALFALDAALRWLRGEGAAQLSWFLLGTGLAVSAKLTALPYLLATAAVLALAFWRRPELRPRGRTWLDSAGLGWASALVLGIGATLVLRTVWLAGVPTIGPEPALRLWLALGFELREPAGSLRWMLPPEWADAPRLAWELLLAPAQLPKIRIGWIGNIWLLAALFALGWSLRAQRPEPGPGLDRWQRAALWAPALAGLWLMFGVGYVSRGSDGNYFVVAVTAAALLAFVAAARRAPGAAARVGLGLALGSACLLQASLVFVAAAWSPPGTRTLDLQLDRPVIDTPERLQRDLKRHRLEGLRARLQAEPHTTRLLLIGPAGAAHLLPVRGESLEHVMASRPEYIAGAEAFAGFLQRSGVGLIAISAHESDAVRAALDQALATLPHEAMWRDPDWLLIALGEGARQRDAAAARGRETAPLTSPP